MEHRSAAPHGDARRDTSPQFEIEPPGRVCLTMNRSMAGNIARFITASFCDGDPPAIWAFAKKLEAASGGAGTVTFDDEEDSHAEERVAQPA